MPKNKRPSPARLFAPLALLAFAFALFLVVSDSSVQGDANKAGGGGSTSGQPTTETTPQAPKRPRKRATYTVKAGDSLGAIAEKSGVDVEALQELNPEVDSQALSPGQKLKLRE